MKNKLLRISVLAICVALISYCSEDPTLPQEPAKDTTPPSVVSTDPSEGAISISVHTNISATFSEDIDTATVKETTFLISRGVTGTISYHDKVATFTPDAALDSFLTYEATLTTGIKDESGNELAADYAWSFRTLSSQENQLPVSDAGLDQDVNRGDVASLDGTGSSDPEGESLSYTWIQVSGPDVTGGHGELYGATPSFTAPSDVSTVQFDLVVNDGIGGSDPDRVQINVMENKNLAVFVSPTGNDDNPGTRSQPVRSLRTAVTMAASGGADVYLAAGIHHLTTTLTLVDGVSLYGGFRASDWARAGDGSSVTTIDVDAPMAILASNINSPTMLDVLTINSGNSSTPGGSAYGVRVNSSVGLELKHCIINAGEGGNGEDGTPHASGAAAGGTGSIGRSGCEHSSGLCDTCARPTGGNGGSSAAGYIGGNGGLPGNGGSSGSAGLPGSGGAAGGPGTPPRRGDWNTPSTYWGANGANGALGTYGTAGSEGSYGSSGYVTINGGDGSAGGAGRGGGGGGGGGGGEDGCDSYGGAGAGGGGGGSGGLGGEGGGSGGGSFAVYLWASHVRIEDCELNTDGGGRGGNAAQGQQGGSGGPGGRYPQGSTSGKGNQYGGSGEQDDGSNGGRGGDGGQGGNGGYGGGGGGGPSIGVLLAGGSSADLTSVNYTIGSGGAGGSGGNSGPAGRRVNTYSP